MQKQSIPLEVKTKDISLDIGPKWWEIFPIIIVFGGVKAFILIIAIVYLFRWFFN
jgi:hypothetical protein|tara:strand:- start:490 stop:654 length:165 start_codon:yes stop_codon:yes gene_type:complete